MGCWNRGIATLRPRPCCRARIADRADLASGTTEGADAVRAIPEEVCIHITAEDA